MRLLAKDPAERFGTGAEVVAALQDGRDAAPRAPFGLARFIAVLPFDNASPEPGTEYLSDGITDELIPESPGGAHRDPALTARNVGDAIRRHLAALEQLTPEQLVTDRYKKFRAMGVFTSEE